MFCILHLALGFSRQWLSSTEAGILSNSYHNGLALQQVGSIIQGLESLDKSPVAVRQERKGVHTKAGMRAALPTETAQQLLNSISHGMNNFDGTEARRPFCGSVLVVLSLVSHNMIEIIIHSKISGRGWAVEGQTLDCRET